MSYNDGFEEVLNAINKIEEKLESSELLRQLVAGATVNVEADQAGPFPILGFDEIANWQPKEFLVKGLIGKGDTSMIYGPPKSKKSLIVLDLCAAIVRGESFAGHFDVKEQANVLYCFGEGHGGMPNRIKALQHKWNLTEEERARFRFGPQVPSLFNPNDKGHIRRFAEYFEALEAYRGWLNGGLLIIDTFARATQGGDENSTSDVSLMIDHIDKAKAALGCAALVIHHENRAGRMRGNTALPGALDGFFKSAPDGGSTTSGRFVFDEAKEGGEFPDLRWSVKIHEWSSEKREEHNGAFIQWQGVATKQPGEEKGHWRQAAIDAVKKYAWGVANAKGPSTLSSFMSIRVSERSLRPFLCAEADCQSSPVQKIMKPSQRENGRAGKESWHFYWDDSAGED